MSLWPALPTELKHLILTLVAVDSDQLARKLRLVSRDTNVLVLPIIFRVIAIENPHDLLATANTILPPFTKFRKPAQRAPRPLSTYNTAALALLLRESLPSIEDALARIGPVFARLQYLAITSRNLSSNAFWLRENRVRPRRIMLLHHGSPRPPNWRDPIFNQVTHILTSSFDSHGCSTLADLPNLTHIAATTRAELSEDKIRYIAHKLEWLLDMTEFPNLRSVVLALVRFPRPTWRSDVSARERYNAVLTRWRTLLANCLASSRFYILPDPNPPIAEWGTWINARSPSCLFSSSSSADIWSKAQEHREKHPNSTIFNPREGSFRRYCLDNMMKSVHINRRSPDPNANSPDHHHHFHSNSSSSSSSSSSTISIPISLSDDDDDDDDPSYLENYLSSSDHHPSAPMPLPSRRCRNNKNKKMYARVEWEIDLVERDGYRNTERLDPEEDGEFEHVFGL